MLEVKFVSIVVALVGSPLLFGQLFWMLRISYRRAWFWVISIFAVEIVGVCIDPWWARIVMIIAQLSLLIWVLWKDPEDPLDKLRRLKKRLGASMTKLQEQVFQRQQVEAFR